MTECEICGEEATKRAEIDGALVNVCSECSKYGKIITKEPLKVIREKPKQEIPEVEKYIDPQYPQLIKSAREKRNMKIEEMAKKINEKESVISRLETGHLSPTFDLARKLEEFLEIKLILEYEKKPISGGNKQEDLTIGDVIDLGELDD